MMLPVYTNQVNQQPYICVSFLQQNIAVSIVSSETIYLEHCREELAPLFIPLWHDPDLDSEQPGSESPASNERVTLGTVQICGPFSNRTISK